MARLRIFKDIGRCGRSEWKVAVMQARLGAMNGFGLCGKAVLGRKRRKID
jgi:hypothetical protein